MAHAFITGSTGFLGHHVVDVLLEQGWRITAMVRDPDMARQTLGDHENLDFVVGDLTEARSVIDAMPENMDAVFHTAADTSSWSRDAERQQKVNVGGTAAILKAMELNGAKRLVHVSSIAVFGHHSGQITEESEHLAANSWVTYARTKTEAEALVQKAVMEGFDAVIVNPTHIVGKYDTQNWARMILKMVARDIPGAAPGAGNFANGRAVAEAIVTAYEKAPRGESYILGGPLATMRSFMDEAANQLGIDAPKRTLPAWLLKSLAAIASLAGKLSGNRPKITRSEAYFACGVDNASSQKAIDQLDYRMVPLKQSLSECIATLREHKML